MELDFDNPLLDLHVSNRDGLAIGMAATMSSFAMTGAAQIPKTEGTAGTDTVHAWIRASQSSGDDGTESVPVMSRYSICPEIIRGIAKIV